MKITTAKLKKLIKVSLKTVKNFRPFRYYRTRYFWYREHQEIKENVILVDCLFGKQPLDNVAAVLAELAGNASYKEYTLYLSGLKRTLPAKRAYLERHGMEGRVQLVAAESLAYYKLLATAKYLVSETNLLPVFTRRSGQVYLNISRGTPLKTYGRNKKTDYELLGNEQKTFLDADYILCSNEYTRKRLEEDYMLANFCKARVLMTGYPRNEVLTNVEKREEIRKACGFSGKQVIAYLPDWQDLTEKSALEADKQELEAYLKAWDDALSEEQCVFVGLHYNARYTLDYSQYRHIASLPEQYTAYEFLSAADILVTDYSEVLFDFALTGRKAVLFLRKKESFMKSRGLAMELSDLPFPEAVSIEELMQQLKEPKRYDDREFISTYGSYERLGVTEALCRRFIFGESSELIKETGFSDNGRKNIIFYCGDFGRNGLTISAFNLLYNLDRTKYNCGVVYCFGSLRKHPQELKMLPEDVAWFGYHYFRTATLSESIPFLLWREIKTVPYKWARKLVERISERSAVRIFGNSRIDHAVQFTGYTDEIIAMMEVMPCRRTIYVHSDMEEEIRTKGNAIKGLLSHAYRHYDNVAVITEGMMAPTRRIAESEAEAEEKEANLVLCKNVIDYKRIRKLGEQEVAFDEATEFSVPEEKLRAVLASDKKKFISIGRFSAEKGHDRLIRAFERVHREQPDTCLIIVGGYGVLYEKTVKQAADSSCPDAIFLVRYMSNPYALLKRCDYFVLSSHYEGFGLVLAEADILGVPCFSTDITGPRRFMEQYGGLLVENSEQGIEDGLRACLSGQVSDCLGVDYEQYNKEAIAQFESLL